MSSSEVVVSSVVVLLSSLLFLAQELTPIVRTDTRTRMSRKYLRKLKMDIILLHEGIKNLNYSVSIILPNQSLIFLRTIDLCLPCVNKFYTLGVDVKFTRIGNTWLRLVIYINWWKIDICKI